MGLYMNLSEETVSEASLKKALKEAKTTMGEDSTDHIWTDDETQITISEIEEDGTIHIQYSGKFGFIEMDVKLDPDNVIKMIEILVKKFNKLKTVYEGLK
jgi:hypothetical protein